MEKVEDKVEMEVKNDLPPTLEKKMNEGLDKDAAELNKAVAPKFSEQDLALFEAVFKIARMHTASSNENDEMALIALINLKNKILNSIK